MKWLLMIKVKEGIELAKCHARVNLFVWHYNCHRIVTTMAKTELLYPKNVGAYVAIDFT